MSIPNFCKVCKNLLDPVDILTGTIKCPVCSTSKKITLNDSVLHKSYHNMGERIVTDIEILRLTTEPTTQKIQRKCPTSGCTNDILALVKDDAYARVTLSCGKCKGIFE